LPAILACAARRPLCATEELFYGRIRNGGIRLRDISLECQILDGKTVVVLPGVG
jgi:hypothetical protein